MYKNSKEKRPQVNELMIKRKNILISDFGIDEKTDDSNEGSSMENSVDKSPRSGASGHDDIRRRNLIVSQIYKDVKRNQHTEILIKDLYSKISIDYKNKIKMDCKYYFENFHNVAEFVYKLCISSFYEKKIDVNLRKQQYIAGIYRDVATNIFEYHRDRNNKDIKVDATDYFVAHSMFVVLYRSLRDPTCNNDKLISSQIYICDPLFRSVLLRTEKNVNQNVLSEYNTLECKGWDTSEKHTRDLDDARNTIGSTIFTKTIDRAFFIPDIEHMCERLSFIPSIIILKDENIFMAFFIVPILEYLCSDVIEKYTALCSLSKAARQELGCGDDVEKEKIIRLIAGCRTDVRVEKHRSIMFGTVLSFFGVKTQTQKLLSDLEDKIKREKTVSPHISDLADVLPDVLSGRM